MKKGNEKNQQKISKQRDLKKTIKEYGLTTIGVLLLAFTTRFFLAPNKIACGGAIGIAIILQNFIPLSVGTMTTILNVILFIIAFIIIGPQFGLKTIYATFALTGSLILMEHPINIFGKYIDPNWAVTNDLMLAVVFGTLLSGIGMGLVFNQNASTGGTDIIAKIMTKFSSADIGKALLAVDFLIALGAGVVFEPEIGMYSLLSVIINGFTIDGVIGGLTRSKEVMIISKMNDEISRFITEELNRGCTLMDGKGGYSGIDTYILYTVVGRKEFIRLRNYIKEIDTKAFITINDVNEVLGEGFKSILAE